MPIEADAMMEELTTPRLVLDAERVRRNVDRMAAYGAGHQLNLRPHTKTHKSIELARLQLAQGATGLTVAKVGEAVVMSEAGADLLMAYPAVDARRCAELARLAREVTVRVGLDSSRAADALAAAARAAGSVIGILVDLDIGFHRTGVPSPTAALALAQHVAGSAGLRLDGIMCYPGHIGTRPDAQAAQLAAADALLAETIDLWSRSGLAAPIVSGGSTPTMFQSHQMPHVTEIRPGTYIFNDMNSVHGGYVELDDCAARIICTVVSDAVAGQVIIDAGTKTLTSDRCGPAPDSGHGYVVEYPQAKITKLSEEHGQIDVTKCERTPRVGERVTVIPNHICPCVNLQDFIYWSESGNILRAMRVDARGKVF